MVYSKTVGVNVAQEIDPKRSGVRARFVSSIADTAEPGCMKPVCNIDREFQGFMFTCPGCGQRSFLRAGAKKPEESPSWQITSGGPNDVAHLALKPSIHHDEAKGGCGWHGWLTDGVFVI